MSNFCRSNIYLFFNVNKKSISNAKLSSDKISKWTSTWKMSFTSNPNKQAIEACFSNTCYKENYPPMFNSTSVQLADSQKRLGLNLVSKLKFNAHTEYKINKCNKIIRSMKKLSLTLSRKSLITKYNSFVRPRTLIMQI